MTMLNTLEKYDVVLGSNSPRRRELLNDMGVTFRVETVKGIDETYPASLPIEEIPVYLARVKAEGHPLKDNELLIPLWCSMKPSSASLKAKLMHTACYEPFRDVPIALSVACVSPQLAEASLLLTQALSILPTSPTMR